MKTKKRAEINGEETKSLMKVREEAYSPATSIREAIAGNADLDKVAKLMELQERWEANEARKAYHFAMAAFKSNPPEIEKDKKVSYPTNKGNVGYRHASLANVTRKINEAMSKFGLSASWKVQQTGIISVTCKITHEKGHSEETTLSAPADDSGSKNPIQAIGSTISYLERYTLLALAGLATTDMDNDTQNSVSQEKISVEEVNSIADNLLTIGASMEKFCEYMNVNQLNDILKTDLKKATIAIENAKAKKAVKK